MRRLEVVHTESMNFCERIMGCHANGCFAVHIKGGCDLTARFLDSRTDWELRNMIKREVPE
jgi:hypothetical protein